ncbi:MAG: NUDIX domain-containing protein [Parasphingorhabdus sp.]|nr:NUDIX domain-containing protein [Parasphingorhabdus sp.]
MTAPPEIDPLTGKTLAPAIAAATLVIFRDRPGNIPPNILMVERSAKMAFAAGAAVFPGGRVDPADFAYAEVLGFADVPEFAARIAAVREAIEETGIAVALDGDLAPERLQKARAALHDGADLRQVCESFQWQLDLEALIPFARWCPPFAESRRFDTRFYLARHDDHGAEALVDATENYNLFWNSAQGVIDRAAAGEVKIIFPTARNLDRLAQYNDFAAARADALRYPVETVAPFVEERDGVKHLCIPDHLGYPVTSEPFGRALRGSE